MDVCYDVAMAARTETGVVYEWANVVEGAVGGVGEGFVAARGVNEIVCDTHGVYKRTERRCDGDLRSDTYCVVTWLLVTV